MRRLLLASIATLALLAGPLPAAYAADTTLVPTGLVQIEEGASEDSWGLKLNNNTATLNGLFDTVGGSTAALKVSRGGTGAITLTGLLKGNGTSAFTAATAGTDYYAPGSTDVAVADGGTGASTLTGILKGNGTSAFTAVTAPSGAIVGTTDTQTLTNKTLTGAVLNGTLGATTPSTVAATVGTLNNGSSSGAYTFPILVENNGTGAGTGVGIDFTVAGQGHNSRSAQIVGATDASTMFFDFRLSRGDAPTSSMTLTREGGAANVGSVLSMGGDIRPMVADGSLFGSSTLRWAQGFWGRTTDGGLHTFYRSGSAVGSITVTATATAFNTSSDYRLKTNVTDADPAASLALISRVRLRDFDWKASGTHDRGVLAHELQAVKPTAVTGVKDGKDMQAVDYSKLVPDLIGAVQALKVANDNLQRTTERLSAANARLTVRVSELEGKPVAADAYGLRSFGKGVAR